MRRALFALWILIAPGLALLTVTGCEQEVKSVRSEQRVEESEPQMQSPGKTVLE